MTVDRTDSYAALGLTPNATQGQVRRAYRTLLRRHHPDTRSSGSPTDETVSDTRLQQVIAAYAVLRDQARRTGHEPTDPQNIIRTRSRTPLPRSAPDQPPIRVGPVRWHGFRR